MFPVEGVDRGPNMQSATPRSSHRPRIESNTLAFSRSRASQVSSWASRTERGTTVKHLAKEGTHTLRHNVVAVAAPGWTSLEHLETSSSDFRLKSFKTNHRMINLRRVGAMLALVCCMRNADWVATGAPFLAVADGSLHITRLDD